MFPFWLLLITPCCSKSATRLSLKKEDILLRQRQKGVQYSIACVRATKFSVGVVVVVVGVGEEGGRKGGGGGVPSL